MKQTFKIIFVVIIIAVFVLSYVDFGGLRRGTVAQPTPKQPNTPPTTIVPTVPPSSQGPTIPPPANR